MRIKFSKHVQSNVCSRITVDNREEREIGRGERGQKKMRNRFSAQNFRQRTSRHLLTRTIEESSGGGEGRRIRLCRELKGGLRGMARGQGTKRERERDLPQQGTISGNFGKRVRLYTGSPWSRRTRAPGDGTVLQLKAIFP